MAGILTVIRDWYDSYSKRVGLENVRILAPRLAVTLITILYGLFWGYIVIDPISCLLETTRKVTVF